MSAYWKIVSRSIRKTKVRFFAIMSIIALGVGFFAGLKDTTPSFFETGNRYINDYNFYNFRILSDIGLNDEDLKEIRKLDGVENIEGASFVDIVTAVDNDVVRFHTITHDINKLKLEEGRLPEKENEIVVDAYSSKSDVIGDTLSVDLHATPTDNSEKLKVKDFTIVGRVRTPLYMNFQRGTSSVGSGNILYFVFCLPEVYDSEYYTESYLTLNQKYYIFDKEYEDFSARKEDELKASVTDIIRKRYGKIIDDAKAEYEKNKNEFEDTKNSVTKELEDAKAQLTDAANQIEENEQKLKDGKAQLDDAKKQIEDGKRELKVKREEINNYYAQLDDGLAQIEDGLVEINSKKDELLNKKTEVTGGIETITPNLEQMEQLLALSPIPQELLPEGMTEEMFLTQYNELKAQKEALDMALNEIETGLATIETTSEELIDQKDEITGKREEIKKGESELNSAENKIESSEQEYNQGIKEYEDGVKELENGKTEWENGNKEYLENFNKFQDEMEKYTNELDEALETIKDKEADVPEVYVLGRDKNPGYVCFEGDAKIVDGVSTVFPVFFFLIAALVCSTTMQRMINDERGQIGAMRALGYSGNQILWQYVIYSGMASLIGCLTGYFIGTRVFPLVIWNVYRMMYGFSDITYKTNSAIFILCLVASLLCSVGISVVEVRKEVKVVPADLIRPKMPLAGKSILLEKVTFFWRKLPFLHKISLRNIFRFKKRMWMMIIGIAGCTSLVIAGFGINDSVKNIVAFQYDNVLLYDMDFHFDDSSDENKMAQAIDETDKEYNTSSVKVFAHDENITHQSKDLVRDVTLIATDDKEISNLIKCKSEGREMPWPNDGEIAVSSKLAQSNNLEKGDEITFDYDDGSGSFTLKIAYVFDNYIAHYALVNVNTYEKVFARKYTPDVVFISNDVNDAYSYASHIASDNDVVNWNVINERRQMFESTMEQLNTVVVLVIVCAALLAFIVLFNLDNINITERVREIATVKVLGFSKKETESYVFRENLLLVIMGFIVGVPLGKALHAFVISQIKMDTVTFVVQIYKTSYLWAFVTVLSFMFIVDLFMKKKIAKIDMAESLKSIE